MCQSYFHCLSFWTGGDEVNSILCGARIAELATWITRHNTNVPYPETSSVFLQTSTAHKEMNSEVVLTCELWVS